MIELDQSCFENEVRGPRSPSLARAALLFAREIAYPDLRPSAFLTQLDDWAEAVRRRRTPDRSTAARAQQLARFLFDELGLRGNREDYDDPRNSYLNEVMTRGLGLPISLSVIFLEVAARLDIPADGIGLPGHFIVAVRLPEARRFLDPFNGGQAVTAQEAARLVRDTTGFAGPPRDEWFAPAQATAVLARMLVNLRQIYVQREAWPEAMAVVERLRILQPDADEHVRDLGLLHSQDGSLRQSARYLEEYLARRPTAPDAGMVRKSLSATLDQLARLN